jgi:hypothetical protein
MQMSADDIHHNERRVEDLGKRPINASLKKHLEKGGFRWREKQ